MFGLPGLLAMTAAAMACSSPAALVGQGGACEVATDCQNGLICIPEKNDAGSVCSNNLNSVQQLPPTPPGADAGTTSDDAEANEDAVGLIPTSLPDATAGD